MKTRTFERDLIEGQQIEKELGDILINNGYKVEYNTAGTIEELKKYDLIIWKNKKITIEVKHDIMSQQTGNVAVEIKCIRESIADYIVYKLGDEFYVIKRKDLWVMIQNGEYKRIVDGGDGNRSRMCLFDMKIFMGRCKQL